MYINQRYSFFPAIRPPEQANFVQKQIDLDNEVKQMREQIKQEEKKAVELEEETKRKEAEKKQLDEKHRAKMKELRNKIRDSALEQEYLNKKIGDQEYRQAKLAIDQQQSEVTISELNQKIDFEISDKEHIAATKALISEKLREVCISNI